MTDFEYAQKIKEGQLPPLELSTKSPLLEHEEVASSFLFLMKKVMLLDEMGVGKTMSSIGACQLISKQTLNKVVIFAPGATLYQWSDAVDTFLGWKRVIVDGSTSHRETQLHYFNDLQEDAVLLTNYSRPLHDETAMLNIKPTTVILDEATFVKNPEAAIHKFISKFTQDAEYIFCLTGTPITLSLGDIYWLFSILHTDVLGTYEEEVLPYLETSGKGRLKKVVGASGFDILKTKIEPYCLRRTLEEVFNGSDDPFADFIKDKPKLEVVPLKVDSTQVSLFQTLKQDANRASKQGTYKPLEVYQAFLQGASSPRLVNRDIISSSPKEEWLKHFISSYDEKVVVYVRYLEYLVILKSTLQSLNIGFNVISGQQLSTEQEKQKQEFLESSNKVLFITGAGKYGLNLQKATTFIFLDIPYNPADILQMINRIYRYGQQSCVNVKLVFMENTIEEDIFRKMKKRQSVLDEYFDTDLSKVFDRDPNYIWGFLEKDYTST